METGQATGGGGRGGEGQDGEGGRGGGPTYESAGVCSHPGLGVVFGRGVPFFFASPLLAFPLLSFPLLPSPPTSHPARRMPKRQGPAQRSKCPPAPHPDKATTALLVPSDVLVDMPFPCGAETAGLSSAGPTPKPDLRPTAKEKMQKMNKNENEAQRPKNE